MPFISPIDGSVQPDTWTGPTHSTVANPLLRPGATLNSADEWYDPAIYAIFKNSNNGYLSIGSNDRPEYSKLDPAAYDPGWVWNGEQGWIATRSVPATIPTPDPGYEAWISHRWAYLHPDLYAREQAASDAGGSFGAQLKDFISSPGVKILTLPLMVNAVQTYLAGGADAAGLADIYGEGTPGATVDWAAAEGFETTTVTLSETGTQTMNEDLLNWWNDINSTPDPFATTEQVNAGWTFEDGYGVDWYNSAGVGEATASSSLDNILGAANKIAGTVNKASAALGSLFGTVQTATRPQPNMQRAAGSVSLPLIVAAVLAFKFL